MVPPGEEPCEKNVKFHQQILLEEIQKTIMSQGNAEDFAALEATAAAQHSVKSPEVDDSKWMKVWDWICVGRNPKCHNVSL